MTSQTDSQIRTASDPSHGHPAARARGLTWRRKLIRGLERFSGLYVLAAIILLFGIWIPDLFLTSLNFRVILSEQAITAIVAFALLIPMAGGTFDLSVAGTVGAALMVVLEMQSRGYHPAIAVLAAVLMGAVVGIVNGLVVVKLSVDSFVATLGMSSILTAVAYSISGGLQITTGISRGFLQVSRQEWFGVPAPVFYMALIGLILWTFLQYRPAGRSLYAAGGNPKAARLAGIRVDRVIFLSLVASGTLAAIAGVLLASRLGAGNPTAGPPYLLPAFTAVFLGATQVKPGRVNVFGTIIAIYLLATGVKALQLVGAPLYINDLFNGAALILAVALAVRSRKAT